MTAAKLKDLDSAVLVEILGLWQTKWEEKFTTLALLKCVQKTQTFAIKMWIISTFF